MLESGTLGTKGNTQVVVPHLTENYGATRDPPEKSIPVCTLKNFPNQIEHTVQWARDWFEGVFKQAPDDVNAYLSNPEVTSTGTPFWTGPKRPPTPLTFDINNPLHLSFVTSVATLRASLYGLPPPPLKPKLYLPLKLCWIILWCPIFLRKRASKSPSRTQRPSSRPSKEEGGGVSSSLDLESRCESIIASLPPPASLVGFALQPVDFDKDVDAHMMVVTATSNLRAANYKIPEADMHKTRQIAGKIIPAIATTTALVTGLVCLELYKLVLKKPIEAHKSAFINLALPLFTFSEPQPPASQKAVVKGEEWKWSAWDRIDIEGDLTLREFLTYMEEQFGLEVSMLSHGVSLLYSSLTSKKNIELRMPMRLSEVVATVTKKPLSEGKKFLILEVICMDAETMDDVEVPYVRLRIK
ncbi:ubiquitin-activating enzyme e1 1 [Nannochloropsis oceanica]